MHCFEALGKGFKKWTFDTVGMPAVVDAAGFLWTGSGSFQYADNGDGSSRTHSIMRFDTSVSTANDASKPILAFTMPDEATVRSCCQSR